MKQQAYAGLMVQLRMLLLMKFPNQIGKIMRKRRN